MKQFFKYFYIGFFISLSLIYSYMFDFFFLFNFLLKTWVDFLNLCKFLISFFIVVKENYNIQNIIRRIHIMMFLF